MSGWGRFAKKDPAKGEFHAQGGNSNTSQASKKSINDYLHYLCLAKQASDYEATTEFLINHVKKVYDYSNDIETALMNRNLLIWLNGNQDAGERGIEWRGLRHQKSPVCNWIQGRLQ